MADVQPFRGICFENHRVGDLARVCTPPYDVISEEEQRVFHERHPHNIVRLILGFRKPSDDDAENRYTRAGETFRRWMSDGLLVQDRQPALYLSAITFDQGNRSITRWGMMARVGLEPFSNGVILPHEKTFSRVKSDRMELMKACHSNFSPIFALLPGDAGGMFARLRASTCESRPDSAFTDEDGHHQRMWRITDPGLHLQTRERLRHEKIYIADGHHRYETALAYRDWRQRHEPSFSSRHPANFVLMYLSGMQDPGLRILPAHRLLLGVEREGRAALLARAESFFDVRRFPFDPSRPREAQSVLEGGLAAAGSETVFGLLLHGADEGYLLRLKPGVMAQRHGAQLPPALLHLDVTVLNHIVFRDIMGFDPARMDNEKLIAYASTTGKTIESVSNGRCDLAFLINPTRIEQVLEIADKGLIMPRKSTYFYPKVITGQVIHSLIDD